MARSNDYICFSLNDEALKIVHVKGQGISAKVVQVIHRNVSGISDVEMIRVIETSVKGLPVKTANIFAVTPPSITTTKNIEIPSTNENEIQSIVSLQASRHTPFSREEIQIGYVNIGVHKGNYTKVLLVIANRIQLKDQVKLFEKSGLKINKVVFAPETVAELYGRARSLKKSSGPVGIIDFDKKNTNFIISKNGKILMSRTIPVGKNDLSRDPSGAQNKIIDELKKTVDSYLSEDIDLPPSGYFFTSNDAFIKDLQPELQSRFGWDIQVAEYADQLKVSKPILQQIATAGDLSFLDVMAAAAMGHEAGINLIPEEVQLQKSIEEQRNQIFQTAILCIVALVLLACIFYLKFYFKEAYLKNMLSQYSDTRQQVEVLKKQEEKTTLLQEFLDSRMVSLDTIYELYKNVSNDVYLTRITMEENGKVNIQGISESTQTEIFELKKTLDSSELFSQADVTSHKTKQEQGTKVYPFEISFNLKSAQAQKQP
ncbi:MAG: pilus assembly protein PilM [Candidatus Omnitrophota bacterium]